MSEKQFLRTFVNFIHQKYISVNVVFLSSMSHQGFWNSVKGGFFYQVVGIWEGVYLIIQNFFKTKNSIL